MHRILLRKKARKELSKIIFPFRFRILSALVRLRNNPYLGEALKGNHKGQYSMHVHPYRIIYEIYKKEIIIYIIIRHRKDVYR